ncbi:cytochrome c [Lacibacter luteus]|uniref:Cytochrome c n=1 Tax=Lacibacter luteus TaxID=2508719 RepID=A0A4Q1CEB1_9BACT|nr:cytochrome c [Lacibacter luteus]RXK57802.1 cytochrome c [Lacibacter luteus]
MKKLLLVLGVCGFIYACGSNSSTENKSSDAAENKTPAATENPSNDPNRGIGKFTKVDVGATLDATMAEAGNKVYDVKCASCHKLSEEKLVGPGWKDVTKRRTAEWIMNFATNTDEMLSKDPEAMAQLEICLVRMPNQGLTDDDARHIYEFMRKNDGVK